MGRDDVDRFVLMRSDLDRYEAQLIPDLQQEALALRNALIRLVAAVHEAEAVLNLEATTSHRSALHGAERLLAQPSVHGTG
jgi:kynureninase